MPEWVIISQNQCTLPAPAYPWPKQVRELKDALLAANRNRPASASSNTKIEGRVVQHLEIDALVQECESCQVPVIMLQEWDDCQLEMQSKPQLHGYWVTCPAGQVLQDTHLPVFFHKKQWHPLTIRLSSFKGYRKSEARNSQGIWAVSAQHKNPEMGFFVFVNCHVCHELYHGKATERAQNERDAIPVAMEAWPKDKEGRPLAAYVVMAGDFNKGGHTEGKLFNDAVIREGLPLLLFDLVKGTCPITGAASWEMTPPPIRFETLEWTRATGEHEILGITRPRTDTKEGLLICVPRNGQGQAPATSSVSSATPSPLGTSSKLQFRKPTESEVAHAALRCATSSDGGNVQIQGPALFGTLNKGEKVLPTQAKVRGVLLGGDITRFPAFDTWNPTTSDMRWRSAKHNGH